MYKYCYFLLSALLVQGCTSINQPTASRSLVEHNHIISIPAQNDYMQKQLSHSQSGVIINLGDETGTLGPRFFAASGVTCRKAFAETTDQRVYCLNALKQWYKVKAVISVYHESENGGSE
jgi:hypothetical protein